MRPPGRTFGEAQPEASRAALEMFGEAQPEASRAAMETERDR